MSNKNEVFEYLIGQLRQQVDNNPYKQQCEDLAHEVQSLKNQLRDASALVTELQETIKLMNEDFKRTTANPEYREELAQFYKDMMSVPEQSGCRKEDVQEREHDYRLVLWCSDLKQCAKCGLKSPGRQKENTQECEHDWRVVQYSAGVETNKCRLCGEEKEVRYK